jgi:hypothetical protein
VPLSPLAAALAEDHLLADVAQVGVDRVVDGKLAGIDDAHIHARLDGVVQEHGMHRFADWLVAAKREREVGDAAGDMNVRQGLADRPGRVDEGDPVAVMFLDAGRDGEDVRVENDVLGRKSRLLRQELVGAGTDFHLALIAVGLAVLVKGHHDDGGAVAPYGAGLFEKRRLAFLHRDGVDDGLALNAFQPRLDDAELR